MSIIWVTRPVCVTTLLLMACASAARGQDLVITEFLAVRTLHVRDDDGDPSEFIEIYNAGTEPEDLGGFFLSDNCANPFKWTFPAGVEILPGDFLVVWASGKDRTDPDDPLHTNFRLNGDGECLVLSDSLGDQFHIYAFYPSQQLGYTYGLEMNGTELGSRQYFPEPTPGQENVAGAPGVAEPPIFPTRVALTHLASRSTSRWKFRWPEPKYARP